MEYLLVQNTIYLDRRSLLYQYELDREKQNKGIDQVVSGLSGSPRKERDLGGGREDPLGAASPRNECRMHVELGGGLVWIEMSCSSLWLVSSLGGDGERRRKEEEEACRLAGRNPVHRNYQMAQR